MSRFRCPGCDQNTITARQKWAATSLAPATCPNCRAEVYPSGKLGSAWRMAEALLVTLVVLLAFASGRFTALVFVIVVIVVAMESLRLFLVPLVRLQRVGGGFR